MANRAKHAFGDSSNIEVALRDGKIDAYDILFLDGDTKPKVGWIDKGGNPVVVDTEKVIDVKGESLPEFGEEGKIYLFDGAGYFWDGNEFVSLSKPTDLTALEAEVATKAGTVEVEAKIDAAVTDSVASAKAYTDGKVEAAINEHMVKKYEFTDAPDGTLVDINENEVRIMCKADAVWNKQNVGVGGDANTYYGTFKTYVYDDNIVGYKERLGNQYDSEILMDLKVDQYGRRYQPTWLGLATYDESTGIWNYYGKNSSKEKYVGWDYTIEFYDANGAMIASDSVRINLSNENCHFVNEPYYVGKMMKEVDTKIEEKIAEVNSAYEIIEF